jgi:hypothetical protein
MIRTLRMSVLSLNTPCNHGFSMDDFAFSDDPHDEFDADPSSDDEAAAYLPPPRTMSDMIRQLSEEGKKLLVAGLSDSVPAPPAVAVRHASPALQRTVETELEDVAAVFGRRAVGPVSRGDDGSLRFQLRLKLHGCALSVLANLVEIVDVSMNYL